MLIIILQLILWWYLWDSTVAWPSWWTLTCKNTPLNLLCIKVDDKEVMSPFLLFLPIPPGRMLTNAYFTYQTRVMTRGPLAIGM
mgnify:CR=1 FL=1